jgi:hypothetical protein
MADDIAAELNGWAEDEIDKQRMGEDYGLHIALGSAAAQTPQGIRMVPAWQLLITARNPLLKEGPLWHFVPLPSARPSEADVRAAVADGMRQLRDLAATKLAGTNGHPRTALPR